MDTLSLIKGIRVLLNYENTKTSPIAYDKEKNVMS